MAYNDSKYNGLIALGYSGQLNEMWYDWCVDQGLELNAGSDYWFDYYKTVGGSGDSYNELEGSFWQSIVDINFSVTIEANDANSNAFILKDSDGNEIYVAQQGRYAGGAYGTAQTAMRDYASKPIGHACCDTELQPYTVMADTTAAQIAGYQHNYADANLTIGYGWSCIGFI